MTGRSGEWGSTEWVKALGKAQPGDPMLAYQTDRNELVGLAKLVTLKPRGEYHDLILKPLKRIGVKFPSLKELDGKIAEIPAFQPSWPKTLYPVDHSNVQRLFRTAGLSIRLDR